MADDVEALREELLAAQKTISTLVKRVEAEDNRPRGMDRYAVLKAMANLESIIEQRTRDLAKSEERYRALYDHAPQPMLSVDTHGVLTDANTTCVRALGRPVAELIGRELSSFFSIVSAERVRELLADGLDGVDEEELRMADGRTFTLTAAAIPGYTDACQVLLRDITEHRELEAELQHTRRLAAIGHLAAGVAHEINNPLAVIQGRVELVDILGVEVPAAVERHLTVIGQHARRIARIVRSLQAFARPRALEREAITVAELIREAIEIAGASISDVTVEVDIAPPDLSVIADRWQIERVLVNLLNNAADAMPDGGTIWLRSRRDGEATRIEVSDEGPGIAPDLLDQVFTPFVSGRTRARRSGLGLAITWGIVQEHGGSIKVQNLDAGGAMFTVVLPFIDKDTQFEPVEEPSTEPPERSLRILCVEDEAALVQMVHRVARAVGHSVITAGTAEEALELTQHHPFDVVLSDVRLPGMSGLDLRERLLATMPTLAKHTVLMSGYFQDLPDDVLYLQKPFRTSDLLATLEQAAKR